MDRGEVHVDPVHDEFFKAQGEARESASLPAS